MGRKSKAQLALEAQQREKENQELMDHLNAARINAEERIRGMPVAEYVAGMLNMLHNNKYESEFHWLTNKYCYCLKAGEYSEKSPIYDFAGKQVVIVKLNNLQAGHCGYCSCQDEDDPELYSEVTEEVWQVVLIDGLAGDPMNLRPSCFGIHEYVECWCGGQTSTREVIDIQVL